MIKLTRFKQLAILALATTLLVSACKSDDDTIVIPPGTFINISGVLNDLLTGNGVAGATVTTTDADNVAIATTVTDGNGFYSVQGEPDGSITFTAAGYPDNTVAVNSNITISLGWEKTNAQKLADWQATFASNNNESRDVGVSQNSVIPTGDVSGAQPVNDGFCDAVTYRGAVDPSGTPWYAGWSFYDNLINGTTTSDPITLGTLETWTSATMDAAGNTVNWTNDKTYILDGFVFVNDGQTLNIQAGTVIQGKSGEAENASALIVARGGKIFAEGTAAQPIIFTFEGDNGNTSATTRGSWGGLILLGKAGLNSNPGETSIEGLPTSELRGLYGGNDDNDNSGVIRYVSIRHGGTNIGADNEINGLTMGGVGAATTIEYVEIVANKDDGIEWFGGTARGKHLIVAFCADDALDYDEGYRGRNQYIIVHQDPTADAADRGGEHDGGTDPESGTPFAIPVFCNVTSIGNSTSRALEFRDNAGGYYVNSIFVDYANGVRIEDLLGQVQDSYKQFVDGNLAIQSCIFDITTSTPFAVNN